MKLTLHQRKVFTDWLIADHFNPRQAANSVAQKWAITPQQVRHIVRKVKGAVYRDFYEDMVTRRAKIVSRELLARKRRI